MGAWLEQIDHTGDVGIRVHARTLETLFERAAWGLFDVVTNVNDVRAGQERTIEVTASDRSDLLVRWLSELNFIHVTEGLLFSHFDVRELSERRLTAIVRGEPIDRARHCIYTEVKAITYHDLKIEQKDGAWEAQVIFDM